MPILQRRLFLAFVFCLLGASAAPVTFAQVTYEFNLPQQSLADSLRAIGQQSMTNILFEPHSVENKIAPPVHGKLSAEEAVNRALAGSKLLAQPTAANTLMVRPVAASTSTLAPLPAQEGEAQLRLAQADTRSEATDVAQNPQAQDQSPAAANSSGLEEVVVTASKRAEALNRLPQAVTAITSQRLDELNAQSFADYFRDVPGLMLIDQGNGKRDYSLRGVSSGQVPTNPFTTDITTVSQYFDEIPVSANGFQMNPRLVDVDRIEVLRGPQGTLYGEGALAGTIRTITRKPVLDRFSASFEGRLSQVEDGGMSNSESAMFNLPLMAGKAALRVTGFYADEAGYVDAVNVSLANQITGVYKKDVNTEHSSGYRAVLLVEPSDRLNILAQTTHFDSHNNGFGDYIPATGDLLTPVRACPPPPPNLPPGVTTNCTGASFVDASRTGNLYNLTLTGDFGWASLVSSSSYAKTGVDVDMRDVIQSGPAPGREQFPVVSQHLKGFTQELRLVSSKAWSDRWDYVIGAYYQDKDSLYENPPGPDFPTLRTNTFKVKEKALFADAGYMLTEHLQARLGLRASDVDNLGRIVIDANTPNPRYIPEERSSFNPVTGRAVLTYFFNQDMMAYGSAARGFRNGNINDTTLNSVPGVGDQPGFTKIPGSSDADTATTYELGWKLSFPTLRATINAAAYHTDWKDMQVISFATSDISGPGSIPAGIAPAYVNAPRATIDGLEMEGGLELLKGLSARVSWSFIDAVLASDFPLNLEGSGGLLHAMKGDRIPFVARSSGSVSLNYRHRVFNTLNGFAIVNAQYQSRRATDFNKTLNTPPPDGTSPTPQATYFEMAPYWTTGMQVGVEASQWRAALYVDNLDNKRGEIFSGFQSRFVIRPRTVGMFLRYNFN